MADLARDERGVSPVVSKTLAIGLAVLYVAGITTVLAGGVVPDYRTQAGDEVGERVLATAAASVERAPPAVDGTVRTRTTVDLPETIRGATYTIVVSNRTMTLVHPQQGIHVETTISLPANVTVVEGRWHSGGQLVVEVTGSHGDRTLRIPDERESSTNGGSR